MMIERLLNTRALTALVVAAITISTLLPFAANAGNPPSADEISAAVSDSTYQGTMSAATSAFAEYYAPDGSIRADGYSGSWRTEDGLMCFQYGDKPEKCLGIELDGPSMVMFKDGEVAGNGMLLDGNPHDF